MLMQMLEAGGMTILTDRVRTADEDNPKGYFEFEKSKKLLRDQSWLAEARGKALKVVAPLICSLPAGYNYRVLLMERDYDEILASQAKMIARRMESGQAEPIDNSAERHARLRREYARIISQTRTVLRNRSSVKLLELCHEDIVRDPAQAAVTINAFSGGSLDISAMASAVDSSLHRNRHPDSV